MAIYIYRSTDTSAPVLNGVAGSFINVLDACLVNGYGDKTSMGWTKEYSGTNIATYRMPVGTSRMYMAVDDTNTTYGRFRGFHDISTAGITGTLGSQPFPSDIQYNGGLYYSKSATANTTARSWMIFSNGKIFYFITDQNSDLFATGKQHCFGDIYSYNPYDKNSCIIIGQNSAGYNPFGVIGPINAGNYSEHYLALRYDGIQKSVGFSKSGLSGMTMSLANNKVMGGSTHYLLQYPHPIGGSIFLSPIILVEYITTNFIVLRGVLPGIQSPIHAFPFLTGDSFNGAVGTQIENKSFEIVRQYWYSGSSLYGNTAIEVSDTQNVPVIR